MNEDFFFEMERREEMEEEGKSFNRNKINIFYVKFEASGRHLVSQFHHQKSRADDEIVNFMSSGIQIQITHCSMWKFQVHLDVSHREISTFNQIRPLHVRDN